MDGIDAHLIDRAKSNRKAFVRIYEKYSEKVFNYFWYRVGFNKAIAEDLTQDTFIRAFQAIDSYSERGYSYGTYLISIAHNLYVNHIKRPQTADLSVAEDIPAEPETSPEMQFDSRLVWYEIQKMTGEQKKIIIMRYWMGMPIRQIAKLIKKSENAVKLVLSRSRRILRQNPILKEAFSGYNHRP